MQRGRDKRISSPARIKMDSKPETLLIFSKTIPPTMLLLPQFTVLPDIGDRLQRTYHAYNSLVPVF
jgi:hypothetical protein